MRQAFASIIIPCFNAEKDVGEAIESALHQTHSHKEVIVIDDGSTDGSLAVIQSFGNAVRWESGPNRGGSAARNRGLELARGEWIQFLDADDLLKPEKLKCQLAVGVDNPDALTYCDYEWVGPGPETPVRIHACECGTMDAVLFVLRTQRLQTSAPLHRAEWLRQVGGFRTELPCAQEYDLHVRLACRGHRFLHVPQVLHTVRQRPRSVSSDSVRVLDRHWAIVQNAFAELDSGGELTPRRRQALAGRLCADARAYLRHGHPERAAAYFAEAARIDPSGGIDEAYGRFTRVLRRVVGPAQTERLVDWKRAIFN